MTGVAFQMDDILAGLAEHGWALAGRSAGSEWWDDEVWTLESIWRPAGKTVFLTFLVDPQWEGERKPGEGVWAVACSPKPMSAQYDAPSEHTIQVSPAWKRERPRLWQVLAAIREG